MPAILMADYRRIWTFASLALIVFLPWQEAGDPIDRLTLLYALALAVALLAPVASPAALGGGFGLGWLAAFLAWGALLALRPGYRFAAAVVLAGQAIPALWLAALGHVPLHAPARRRLTWALVAAACAEALWALLPLVPSGGRAHGSFVNPNSLAAYLNVALATALGMLAHGTLPSRRAAAAATAVLATALLATGSRGGLAGAAAAAAVSLPWRRLESGARRRPWRAATAIAGLVGLAAAGGILWTESRRLAFDPYRFQRLEIWSSAAAVAARRPWTGVGAGQLESIAPAHQFPLLEQPFRYSRRWSSAHSAVLQLLCEEGVVGLGLALAFLAALAIALVARARTAGGWLARAALAGMAALGVHALVEDLAASVAVPLSLATLAGLALAPAATGEGAEEARRGGRGRPVAARAGAAGLAALAVGAWGIVVAPGLAHRAYARSLREADAGRARAALEEAARWNPYLSEYALQIGRSLWRSREGMERPALARAWRWLETAAEIDPHDARPIVEQGHLLRQAAETGALPPGSALRAAARRYERAKSLRPFDPRLRIHAGVVALRLGETARARQEADAALELEPNFLDAYLLATDAALREGDRAAARRELARFREARGRMGSFAPSNEYERDLVQYNEAVLELVEEAVGR